MDLIDMHTHVVPQRFPDNPVPDEQRWPCMQCTSDSDATVMINGKSFRNVDHRSWDVVRRTEDMDTKGITRQVLSPMPELLSYWFEPALGLEMCRWMNQTIAEMVAAAPSRFSGLGIVPLQDPTLAARELQRIKADGFAGVEIGSNIAGTVLGDGRFEEFFAEAADLKLGVFVHALHPIGADRLQAMPDLIPFAAFPLDTALSAISLIRAGVPARHPELKLSFSHGGGAIVPLTHRLAQGWKLTNGFQGKVPKAPHEYARRFYYDSLVYEPTYLAHLANEFAPGQIFGGTDYPYPIMESDLEGFVTASQVQDVDSLRYGAATRFLNL